MSLLEVKRPEHLLRRFAHPVRCRAWVERNEVVALLGRNGAGKSTTLKSLMGVVTPRAGSIVLDGVEIAGKKSHAIAQAGMQLVHEDRRIFGSLNVEENLINRDTKYASSARLPRSHNLHCPV